MAEKQQVVTSSNFLKLSKKFYHVIIKNDILHFLNAAFKKRRITEYLIALHWRIEHIWPSPSDANYLSIDRFFSDARLIYHNSFEILLALT